MPWRRHAAELALAIARDIQARKAEGQYFSDEEDQTAYEAALYAAQDLPDEVASLCLELAKRRDPAPRGSRPRGTDKTGTRGIQSVMAGEKPGVCSTNRRAFRIPIIPLGPLREPWPDGPTNCVEEAFQQACLETQAFPYLIRAHPDVALEVLLAVCIEEPKHEDSFGSSLEENRGLGHWIRGYPPLYFRGPFLSFLREVPEKGLSFILRLVNFATKRSVGTEPRRLERLGLEKQSTDLGVTITYDGKSRRWYGDGRTFRWHDDWPHDAKTVPCALMALERWLYEQLDEEKNIEPWLVPAILQESESLAFAGLLVDIGKRDPRLFPGVLLPLLHEWLLYHLDLEVTIQRSGGNAWSSSGGVCNQRGSSPSRENGMECPTENSCFGTSRQASSCYKMNFDQSSKVYERFGVGSFEQTEHLNPYGS